MAVAWKPVNFQTYRSLRKEGAKGEMPSAFTYNGLSMSSFYFSLETIVELGFANLAQFKNKVNVAFYMLEVACYTDEVIVTDVEAERTSLERYGIGFRLGIANWGISFSSAATLAAVAANAQLGLSQTALELQIAGTTPKIQAILKPLFGLTTFDTQALKQIAGCATLIADYFAQHADDTTPVALHVAPIPVGVPRTVTPEYWFNRFYSNQFAVESIFRGRSINDALSRVAKIPDFNRHVVPDFVAAVYAAVGIKDPYSVPDRDQRSIAEKMLFAGRY